MNPHTKTAAASSRQIEAATRVERKSVQRGLDALARRCLIATRQGGGKTPSRYQLNWTQTAVFPSGVTMTPLDLELSAEVASPERHPSEPQGALDIDRSIDEISIEPSPSILDRTLTARPQHFQRSELDHVRGFAYKWLLLQRGQQHAQPPDTTTAAQLITAAGGVYRASDFIRDNLRDRQAENCQYLVVMMLQKIHGIAPPTTKRRRAELRSVATPRKLR